jgi:hypothetical protein
MLGGINAPAFGSDAPGGNFGSSFGGKSGSSF